MLKTRVPSIFSCQSREFSQIILAILMGAASQRHYCIIRAPFRICILVERKREAGVIQGYFARIMGLKFEETSFTQTIHALLMGQMPIILLLDLSRFYRARESACGKSFAHGWVIYRRATPIVDASFRICSLTR